MNQRTRALLQVTGVNANYFLSQERAQIASSITATKP